MAIPHRLMRGGEVKQNCEQLAPPNADGCYLEDLRSPTSEASFSANNFCMHLQRQADEEDVVRPPSPQGFPAQQAHAV